MPDPLFRNTARYAHRIVPLACSIVVALYWKTEDLAKAVYQKMGRFDPDDYEMMSVESGTLMREGIRILTLQRPSCTRKA